MPLLGGQSHPSPHCLGTGLKDHSSSSAFFLLFCLSYPPLASLHPNRCRAPAEGSSPFRNAARFWVVGGAVLEQVILVPTIDVGESLTVTEMVVKVETIKEFFSGYCVASKRHRGKVWRRQRWGLKRNKQAKKKGEKKIRTWDPTANVWRLERCCL